jgi:hypothetical protein
MPLEDLLQALLGGLGNLMQAPLTQPSGQTPSVAQPLLQEQMSPQQLFDLAQGAPVGQAYRPANNLLDILLTFGRMAQYGVPHSGFLGLPAAERSLVPLPAGERSVAPLPAEERALMPVLAEELPTQTAAAATGKTEQNFTSWLKNVGERQAQESGGQEILDTLDEAGLGPRDVVAEFWQSTYPQLNPKGQAYFHRYIKNLTSMEPGSVVEVGPRGEETIAQSWAEVYPPQELPAAVEHLEGTERGLIAMMARANWAAGKQVKLPGK